MNFKQKIIILFVGLFFLGMFVSLAKSVGADFPGVQNPLSTSSDPAVAAKDAIEPDVLYANILKVALGIVGVFSLVFFIWGGFLWMTAGGNQERVKQGMDTLLWSILGLAAIFASYVILRAAIEVLTKTTIQ
jgi:hypothetical protein